MRWYFPCVLEKIGWLYSRLLTVNWMLDSANEFTSNLFLKPACTDSCFFFIFKHIRSCHTNLYFWTYLTLTHTCKTFGIKIKIFWRIHIMLGYTHHCRISYKLHHKELTKWYDDHFTLSDGVRPIFIVQMILNSHLFVFRSKITVDTCSNSRFIPEVMGVIII